MLTMSALFLYSIAFYHVKGLLSVDVSDPFKQSCEPMPQVLIHAFLGFPRSEN